MSAAARLCEMLRLLACAWFLALVLPLGDPGGVAYATTVTATAGPTITKTITPTCVWTDRGIDKFSGDVPSAVDTYTHIPADTRAKLKARMQQPRQYDDIAHITAAGVASGAWQYGPLRMMHFGTGARLCGVVTTNHWPAADAGERALIYCQDGHCIAVPTVCRNVSLITRMGPTPPTQANPPAPPATLSRFKMSTISTEGPAGTPPAEAGGVDVGMPPIAATAPEPTVSFTAQLQPVNGPGPADEPPEQQPNTGPGEEPTNSDPFTRPLFVPSLLGGFARMVFFMPTNTPALTTPTTPAPLPITGAVPVPGIDPPTTDGRKQLPPTIGTAIMVPYPGAPEIELPIIPPETPLTAPPKPAAPGEVPGGPTEAVQPVPEPAEWVLMLGGLAMVARWVRRGNVLVSGPHRR